jgi:hypothetical protein
MGTSELAVVISAHVESRPLPAAFRDVVLPDEDDVDPARGDALGFAEGQTFMIEYVDSMGEPSRRRITVFEIATADNGIPLLVARCHERRAIRSFRIDRIQCCIDYDGEVHENVPAYLTEVFGMSVAAAARRPSDPDKRWEQIFSVLRNDAVILAAVARSDRRLKPSELDVATRYLVRLVENSTMIFLTEDEVKSVARHIERLRPRIEAIDRALPRLTLRGADAVMKLLLAAVDVMDADDDRHPAEMQLINMIAQELLGHYIV